MAERLPKPYSNAFCYWVATCAVTAVTLACLLSSSFINFLYLVGFIAAICLSCLFGRGPGLAALVLAVLLSDFFFVPPVFRFVFNRITWLAAFYYGLAALLTFAVAHVTIRDGRDQKLKLLLVLLSQKFLPPQTGTNDGRPKFLGRLDGVAGGEIFGWALDEMQPSSAPTLEVYVEDRPVGEFAAVHYRPDVGRHAFYFDLSQSCPPAPAARVEAIFRNGQRLARAPLIVSIPPPCAGAPSGDCSVHAHFQDSRHCLS